MVGAVVGGARVREAALLAGFEVFAHAEMAWDAQDQHVRQETHSLRPLVHVMSEDDASDEVDDVVGPDEAEHDPLVDQDEEDEVAHLVPLGGPVLQTDQQASAHVPRVEEVVHVVVGYRDRVQPRVEERETLQAGHEEVLLEEGAGHEEQHIPEHYAIGAPVEVEEPQEREDHQVHQERGEDDVAVLDVFIVDEELVEGVSGDEGVVAHALLGGDGVGAIDVEHAIEHQQKHTAREQHSVDSLISQVLK